MEKVMVVAPVIPVLVIDRLENAVPIATALIAGGLPALEGTLCTPFALDAIRTMARGKSATVNASIVLDAFSL